MAETATREPALGRELKDWGPALPFFKRLTFEERPGRIVVRLEWPITVPGEAVDRALGFATRPLGRAIEMAGITALLLAPSSVLAVSDELAAGEVVARFAGAMATIGARAVDLSHGQVAVAVQGSLARALLSGLCPLDLDKARFGPGSVARTAFAGHGLTLHCTGPDGFDIYCERSWVSSLWSRIEAEARMRLGET